MKYVVVMVIFLVGVLYLMIGGLYIQSHPEAAIWGVLNLALGAAFMLMAGMLCGLLVEAS